MKKRIYNIIVVVSIACMTAGCCCKEFIKFHNGTSSIVKVRTSESGNAVKVATGKSRELSDDFGDLYVSTHTGDDYLFKDVGQQCDWSDNYYTCGQYWLGACVYSRVSVKLETNMCLYVLFPGKHEIDNTVQQPPGYPKQGLLLKGDQ